MFEKFDDDGILLTTALSPGLGIGSQHTYVYIKGKIAARVVPRVAMELNYQWTPYNGSLAWMNTPGDHAGLAMAVLRYTTYFAVTEETSLMLYFDWRQSNLDSPMPGSDPALAAFDAKNGIYNSGAFSPIFRTRVDNNFRIGFGVAF